MRLLLSACWHLGRRFHGRDGTADHVAALRSLARLARSEDASAVVVAADLHDGSASGEAASEEAVAAIVAEAGVPVVVLPGSATAPPGRTPLGHRVLAAAGLHVVDGGWDPARPLPLPTGATGDRWALHAVPIPAGADDAARAAALADGIRRAGDARRGTTDRAVLVLPWRPAGDALAGLRGFDACVVGGEAEPLPVAGRIEVGGAVAPGAPWPAALREVGSDRGVTLLSLEADGAGRVERRELGGGLRVVAATGTLEALEEVTSSADATAGDASESSEELLVARLTDPVPLVAGAARLGAARPELLAIERRPARRGLTPAELVSSWVAQRSGARLNADDRALLDELAAAPPMPSQRAPS